MTTSFPKLKKITENIIYIYTLIKNFESISYIVKIVAIETVFFSLRSEIFPGMNSSGGEKRLAQSEYSWNFTLETDN